MAISIQEAVPTGPVPDDPPRSRRGGRGRAVVEVVLLAALAIAMLFPVLWILETSIKENRDVYAVPAKFFGFRVTLDHYKDAFVAAGGGRSDLSVAFLNSVIVAGGSTALATLFGVPAAWAYSRFDLRAKKDQLFFILSTRFMPPVVVVIPVFLMYRQLGLINTKLGLVLIYAAFNVSFTIWMMKGFVDEVPSEYEDAAMLDGYTRLQAFRRVHPAAARARHRRDGGLRADLLLERVRVRHLPHVQPGRAHGPTGHRRPHRRHHRGLGPGRRLRDGVRDPGAGVRLPGAQAPRRRRDARGGASLMAGIEVTSLHKRYPDGTVAVEHVDLSIRDGELFVMLGPSGCGKTTTLRAVAGLEQADVGRHPHRRHAGQRPAARRSATSPWCSSSTPSTRT